MVSQRYMYNAKFEAAMRDNDFDAQWKYACLHAMCPSEDEPESELNSFFRSQARTMDLIY